jgi:GNAT superfamily N-acetyltransferase
MPTVQVVRTYLEMLSPDDLHPARQPADPPRLERMEGCPPSFFRYLYAEVGRAYHWTDRLGWSDEQVRAHLADPDVSLWLLSSRGSPAGYFELRRHQDDSVEVAYFGLLPEFVGRGWGGHLLTLAVRAAWGMRPERVWLHTCTLDHPAALPNYLKRGFRPVREESYTAHLPNSFTPNPRT